MSWDTIDKNAPKGGGDWFRLQPGDNHIRIVSEPVARGTHFIKEESKSYPCLGKDEFCPRCEAGHKPTVKFLFYVIDRKEPVDDKGAVKIKIAELGWTVAKALRALQKEGEYAFPDGDLPPYDVNIKKEGEKLDTEYTVFAARKDTPLSDTERQAVFLLKPLEDVKEALKGNVAPAQTSSQTQRVNVPHVPTPPPDDNDIRVEDIPF